MPSLPSKLYHFIICSNQKSYIFPICFFLFFPHTDKTFWSKGEGAIGYWRLVSEPWHDQSCSVLNNHHGSREWRKQVISLEVLVWVMQRILMSSASVRPIPLLSFIEPIFARNVPLVSLIFLKRSLVFSILLFSSISLQWSLRKAFLSLLAILWNSPFKWEYLSFSLLPFASVLPFFFLRPQKTFLHFFFLGMV